MLLSDVIKCVSDHSWRSLSWLPVSGSVLRASAVRPPTTVSYQQGDLMSCGDMALEPHPFPAEVGKDHCGVIEHICNQTSNSEMPVG